MIATDKENELTLSDSVDLTSSSTVNESLIYSSCPVVPVPLQNKENVCFFNSVVQVFYSLHPFRARIFSDLLDNHVIRNMRQLFTEMESMPSYDIHTHPIVRALQIPHYIIAKNQENTKKRMQSMQ